MGYKKLRLLLKFETNYVTPLMADTLFGEFCWVYGWLKGEDELKRLLRDGKPIAFSDIFPEGYLPFPKYPKDPFSVSPETPEEYGRFKRLKKRRYLEKEIFKECIEKGGSFESILCCIRDKVLEVLKKEEEEGKKKEIIATEPSIHVSIDRIKGTAAEGKLYHLEETFTEKGELYVLYKEELLSKDDIKEIFQILGLVGVGAKKSAGKGKFSVEVSEGWDLPEVKEKNWFISLSTGLPRGDEVEEYYAEFFTKYPKHGREVAIPRVFKNPVILAKPGSVFKISEERKQNPEEPYGELKSGVSPLSDKGHRHSFLIVPLFVG
ncbi:type III-A CRISPR-associated RAMP protein Csm4 [Phorcysia thermohydrogeniphila]|uniref:CRISPR system Cms protein Csm4 n=1 Tax=Phorcysia thermohydrogeniphila TaxID=936138 RepID=A0A4R1GGX5_9BACT|nr:RAMP superfamily CRISPR-associated protein [Phorcysia thermohydrogeniphila]TCK06221.1 CRISPR-associated Csm4 family protein [Phorcysia thermohydrogeniphila]